TVLERRGVVGGAAVTEEFHPGFRNSVASYTVSLLQRKVSEDLDLHGHGLRVLLRRRNNFLPLPDGGHLLTGGGRTAEEVAKFSRPDAEMLPAYEAPLDGMADVLRALVPAVLQHLLYRFPGSGARHLNRWFESGPVRALFGVGGTLGNYASHYAPGAAYELLHHVFGKANGFKGAWGHAIGGMGAITP